LTSDETIIFLPGELGERALRTRLVAGDDAAFRECYEQHAPKLMRILSRILRNQATAEEVLQDTFVAAFRSIAQFRGDVSLASWLTRIAMNRAYNAIRDESRRVKNIPPLQDDTVPGFEPHVEGRDLARKVMRLLDEMDSPKKVALLLQAEGYSVAEIAEITQEPRGTILARLSRSRAELALRMASAGLATYEVSEASARMEDQS
jgi:RNA polymerase sigma-70 factor (ECF subfamily)